jgi:xanthine/uracil permease
LGICLILYMVIEVWFVGLRNFLQPLYFILGVIVLIIGLNLFKSTNKLFGIEVESTPNKLSA